MFDGQIVRVHDDLVSSGRDEFAATVASGQHKRWSELVMVAGWYMNVIKQQHPELPDDPLVWRPRAAAIMEAERTGGGWLPVGTGASGVTAKPTVAKYMKWVFAKHKEGRAASLREVREDVE